MLSKEEIKKALKVISNDICKECYFPKRRTCSSCINKSKIIIKQYIKQLESELEESRKANQKLIEKLEEDILNADDNIKHMNEKNILQIIARELATGMRDYAQESLSLLKGEKE